MVPDSGGSRKAASPYINVTPLIDVLLVLLIIFMVVSPLKPSRFKTMVPEPPAKDQIIEPNPLTLVVSVDNNLRLRLNQMEDMGSVGDMGRLNAALAELFERRREAHTFRTELSNQSGLSDDQRIEKTVFIKAPRSIRYGEVAKVIDGIKGAGANPIGLQIDDLAQ